MNGECRQKGCGVNCFLVALMMLGRSVYIGVANKTQIQTVCTRSVKTWPIFFCLFLFFSVPPSLIWDNSNASLFVRYEMDSLQLTKGLTLPPLRFWQQSFIRRKTEPTDKSNVPTTLLFLTIL